MKNLLFANPMSCMVMAEFVYYFLG